MELRKTIRRPSRYEPDQFPTPKAKESPFEIKEQLRPQVIQYNPKLPAAAFPTIPVIPTRPQSHTETAEDPRSQPHQKTSQSQTRDDPNNPLVDKAQFDDILAKPNEIPELTEEDLLMREMESSVEGESVESDIEIDLNEVNTPSGILCETVKYNEADTFCFCRLPQCHGMT